MKGVETMPYYMNESLESATNRYLAEQEDKLNSLPVCDYCGEPIQDDYYFELEPWKKFCESCAEEWMYDRRHPVETE